MTAINSIPALLLQYAPGALSFTLLGILLLVFTAILWDGPNRRLIQLIRAWRRPKRRRRKGP